MACNDNLNLNDAFSRINNKLQQRLNKGEFYEAHQLYRTLNFRLCSQKKYNQAIDLLMSGSLALFEANQISSGVDLALQMIDLFKKTDALVNSENIAKVTKLHRIIPTSHVDRAKFVVESLNWARICYRPQTPLINNNSNDSKQIFCNKNNDDASEEQINRGSEDVSGGESSSNTNTKVILPKTAQSSTHTAQKRDGSYIIHGEFGITYWQEKDYLQARYHFFKSCDGEACASMLIEYHLLCGFPYEVDMFIAQAVLHFLCTSNAKTAEICFNRYTTRHPQVEHGPPYIRPLLNFLWLLLNAVERGNITIFTVLCEQYDPTLKRDPSYHDYLARIGQLFFNLPQPKKVNNFGILGTLIPELLKNETDFEGQLYEEQKFELD